MSLSFASTAISAEEFRQRRAEAVREGNPAWLWREVPVADWAHAMAKISEAVSAVLAGRQAKLVCGDPMAMSLACYTSGVGPLLGCWAEQKLLIGSGQLGRLLALHLQNARARSNNIVLRSKEIVSKLAVADVPVIVLKGGHTAHAYFPDPGTRPASDLDLLVPSDRAVDAEVTLVQAGLTRVGGNARESSWAVQGSGLNARHLWLVGPEDPWSVDLHRSLDFQASPGAPLVRFDSAEPFTSVDAWAAEKAAGALRQPLQLLHLAVHASGGLQSLTLLRMVEIILVVRQDIASQQLLWPEFLELGAQIGALGAAYPALYMSEKLAPGTFPEGVLAISRELAPARVRRIVEKLEPANVQRIDRASIAEHFMWVQGPAGWAYQLGSDLTAAGGSGASIYLARAYRLLRGRITR